MVIKHCIHFLFQVQFIKDDGVDETVEVCTLALWYHRFYDSRLLEVNWDTRATTSDTDHNLPFKTKQAECGCTNCSCTLPWRQLWDRYFASGYQSTLMEEGQTFIWIQMTEIDPLQYYGVSLYWSAQSVGTIGMGDLNILDHPEMLWSFFLLMVGVFLWAFVLAELTACLVVLDPLQAEIFLLVGAQRVYLKDKKQSEMLNQVTQAEEMRFASKIYLIENERENLPRALYSQIRLESIKNILPALVGQDSNLTRGQLRLLALNLKRVIIPRGDYMIRDQDLISSVYILVEGFLKIKYSPGEIEKKRSEEDFNDAETIAGLQENNNAENDGDNINAKPGGNANPEVAAAKDRGTALSEEEHDLVMRSAEKNAPSILEPGSCFGLRGQNDYEFWTGNIVAKVPSQVL